MPWREAFLRHLGPGLLSGIAAGDWFRMLRENRFAVAPSRLPKAMAITLQSLQNSIVGRYETWRYRSKYESALVHPPLFLLGHWRHGTTHLHNLFAVDDRFAYPNNFEAFFPHTFLTTEAVAIRLLAFFLPRRRPMDNIEWTMRSPQEDEFALAIASGVSPCLGWMFPNRREHYDRHLTLRDASADETARWKAAFARFVKKLSWKYGRPLVLKSPPHTGRIAHLLELFPGAKFVHIHRDPYAVFASTAHMLRVNGEFNRLQRRRDEPLDDWVLGQYVKMYDAFFEEWELIPSENRVEIGFEALEVDPLGQLRRVYEALRLPEFNTVEPAMRRYVDSIEGYRKNAFPELSVQLRSRIATEWRRSFETWSYPVGRQLPSQPPSTGRTTPCT